MTVCMLVARGLRIYEKSESGGHSLTRIRIGSLPSNLLDLQTEKYKNFKAYIYGNPKRK